MTLIDPTKHVVTAYYEKTDKTAVLSFPHLIGALKYFANEVGDDTFTKALTELKFLDGEPIKLSNEASGSITYVLRTYEDYLETLNEELEDLEEE